MASLSETPAMRQARETAFRDKSLLNKRYRQARASGDFGTAMSVAQQADKMGMPVGTTGSFDQLAQVGQRRYQQDMFRAGMEPEKTGLAAFDFRQAAQRGAPGVGGFDFRQAAQRQAAPMQSGQTQLGNLTNQFRKMYKDAQDDTAESDQAQADIVAEAYAQGVPLSGLGMDILRKSQPQLLSVQPEGQPESTQADDYGMRAAKSRRDLFIKQPAFAKRRIPQQPGRLTLR